MLFLIRHAHAVPTEEDPRRQLSLAGNDECTRLVGFFTRNHLLKPETVWHSPLARSFETADRLVKGLRLETPLVEVPGLLGEDDPQEIADRIAALPPAANIAIVGHEPHLGHLATLLVRGRVKPVIFNLKKGAVVALNRTEHVFKKTGQSRWQVRWLVTPELLAAPGTPGELTIEGITSLS